MASRPLVIRSKASERPVGRPAEELVVEAAAACERVVAAAGGALDVDVPGA